MENFGHYLAHDLARAVAFPHGLFSPTASRDPAQIARVIKDQLDIGGAARVIIEKRIERHCSMIKDLGGDCRKFGSTDWMAIGLGIPTLLENGIQLDWSSGWPIVPGPSLKGAVRAWVEYAASEGRLSELGVCSIEDFVDIYFLVFGCGPDEDDHGSVGTVRFFDSWFHTDDQTRIGFDVMTPHYGDYQRNGASPSDWLNPNPVPFLAVEPGATLVVGLAPRGAGDQDLISIAWKWVEPTLAENGLGAKIAEGMGRFTPKS